MNVLAPLREAAWLHGRRATAWAAIAAIIAAIALAILLVSTRFGTGPDQFGRPLGTDFSSFWTAGRLALAGDPAAPYNPALHAAAERLAFPPDAGYAPDYYAFFYPPPFLLLCLTLAVLPYGLAVIAWLVATGAAYVAVIRAMLPRGWTCLAVLSFPALFVNAGHGQNGALSAALLGGASLLLERRPALAGLALGTLCYKPQLALLIFPALLVARRWRALAFAAFSVAGLCLASLAVFGASAWHAFLAAAGLAQIALETGAVGFGKMVSPFAAARVLGSGVGAAWSVQVAASAVALAVLVLIARRRPGAGAECAVLAASSCLATPFLLDYDLTLLAVPLAWLAAQATRGAWLPWEKAIAAASFALPLAARPVAMHAGLPLAPLIILALLAVAVRRLRAPLAADCLVGDRPGWQRAPDAFPRYPAIGLRPLAPAAAGARRPGHLR